MAFELSQSAGSVVIVKLTGQLNKIDLDRMQAAALEAIKRWGTIRVLVLLENFTGWERDADWDDVSFCRRTRQGHREAGARRRREMERPRICLHRQGYRATSVEYFTPSERDRAYAWVGASQTMKG